MGFPMGVSVNSALTILAYLGCAVCFIVLAMVVVLFTARLPGALIKSPRTPVWLTRKIGKKVLENNFFHYEELTEIASNPKLVSPVFDVLLVRANNPNPSTTRDGLREALLSNPTIVEENRVLLALAWGVNG